MIRPCAAPSGYGCPGNVDTDRDAYILVGTTYRHAWCCDPRGTEHRIGDQPAPPFTVTTDPHPSDGLDVPDPMSDLIDRLERANGGLLEDADAAMARGNTDGGLRLANKAEGVRLALSYAREYKRGSDRG